MHRVLMPALFWTVTGIAMGLVQELHRQKQKFLAVSERQKEVFDRLRAKYNEAVRISRLQADQILQMQQQLQIKDKDMAKVHGAFNQLRQELASERARSAQLSEAYDLIKV